MILWSHLHCTFHEIHWWIIHFQSYLFQRGSKYFNATFEVFVATIFWFKIFEPPSTNTSKVFVLPGGSTFSEGVQILQYYTEERGLKYLDWGELFLGAIFLCVWQTVMFCVRQTPSISEVNVVKWEQQMHFYGTRIFACVYVLEDFKSVFNLHTQDCNNSSAFPVSIGCNLYV